MKISRIIGREIFDSRGLPTVQCELTLLNGFAVTASVPSGKSKSIFEAYELRDSDNVNRLAGMGVKKAIENIENIIAPCLIGKEPSLIEMDQEMIQLDGTANKSSLGANAILAVSQAICRAESLMNGMELYEFISLLIGENSISLPMPFFNLINGGAHAKNNLTIQEFAIVPTDAPTFRAAYEFGVSVFYELNNILKKANKKVCLGDEGGYSIDCTNSYEALDLLLSAINTANSKTEDKINCQIALDVASSQFYNTETKLYNFDNNLLNTAQLISYYQDLITKYPIFSIEDGLSETDWDGWKQLNQVMDGKIQIIGDDIFATNFDRIVQGSYDNIATAVIIKPNQVGTITETLQAIKASKELVMNTVISRRSGETEDNFISDLVVGTNAGCIKAGGCCRTESVSKYNRLLQIEESLMFRATGEF